MESLHGLTAEMDSYSAMLKTKHGREPQHRVDRFWIGVFYAFFMGSVIPITLKLSRIGQPNTQNKSHSIICFRVIKNHFRPLSPHP